MTAKIKTSYPRCCDHQCNEGRNCPERDAPEFGNALTWFLASVVLVLLFAVLGAMAGFWSAS